MMTDNNKQGFFVRTKAGQYIGPHETLNDAREEARKIGTDLLIYHGILKRISKNLFDDSQLYLVPKLEK